MKIEGFVTAMISEYPFNLKIAPKKHPMTMVLFEINIIIFGS